MWNLLSCSVEFLPQTQKMTFENNLAFWGNQEVTKSDTWSIWWLRDGWNLVLHQKLLYREGGVTALSWCRIQLFIHFSGLFGQMATLKCFRTSNIKNRIHSKSQLWNFGYIFIISWWWDLCSTACSVVSTDSLLVTFWDTTLVPCSKVNMSKMFILLGHLDRWRWDQYAVLQYH
jgi:hypothetical protein